MSQVCQVTGKRPQFGNNVSHSNRKTRRRFNVNLHTHTFQLKDGRLIKLRTSSKGLRLIDKKGIDQVLAEMRKNKETLK